jgi:hypothetical protein
VVAFEAAGCALRLLGIKVEKPRGGAGGLTSSIIALWLGVSGRLSLPRRTTEKGRAPRTVFSTSNRPSAAVRQ